ncbi:MAG: cytochrome C biogenesis protein [Pelodictyon luteolum]|uniref:Cytochrome C biogenesis protein n=1 Tax=Pelodictyon luteolum TaxID=1100 RepID=A0A165LF47_PELLU|nr:cytochrome c biogenesis protein CcsA [Pelodictyon luteolum]KZK73952.1 MAG: cytochrome C biogenesis protein [Pelodictyon luteolum]
MNNIILDNTPLFILTQVVSMLYIVTTILYGAHFFKDSQSAKKYKQPALVLTVLTHLVYLGLLTSIAGYRIGYSTFNIMTMVALTLTTTYFFIEFTTKSDKTGFFVIAFATGAELISSIMTAQTSSTSPSFTGIGMGVHLIAAIFGFSAIAIAGLYSFLYLLLFRQIQRNRFELLFQRLPNLEVLERLIMHAVAFGFIFLSVTLFAGMVEQNATGGVVNISDPKLVTLGLIWLIYGTSIFIRPLLGWDIKHMAYLLIFLFVFITLLITLMAVFSPTFHSISL